MIATFPGLLGCCVTNKSVLFPNMTHHAKTGVAEELDALYDAKLLWTFEKAWQTSKYDQLGLSAKHKEACRQEWNKRVAEWNQVRNEQSNSSLPDSKDAKTFGYCALCMLPPSLVCFDDPEFALAFQRLDRHERRAINILYFYQTNKVLPLGGVHTLEDLTEYPVYPPAWKKHNAKRYESACYRYTVILLRRNKGLHMLQEESFRDWNDTD